MKLPKTMPYVVFMVCWKNYEDYEPKYDENENNITEYSDALDAFYGEVQKIHWVDRVEDPGGAQRAVAVIVDVTLIPEWHDLFWVENEILMLATKLGIRLDLS